MKCRTGLVMHVLVIRLVMGDDDEKQSDVITKVYRNESRAKFLMAVEFKDQEKSGPESVRYKWRRGTEVLVHRGGVMREILMQNSDP